MNDNQVKPKLPKEIEDILLDGEEILLTHSYNRKIFDLINDICAAACFLVAPAIIVWLGFVFLAKLGDLIPVIIAMSFVTLYLGISLYRGLKKYRLIITRIDPDVNKLFREYFAFTNKRWIQKSTIFAGIRPDKKHKNLYKLFKNTKSENKYAHLFERDAGSFHTIFINLNHIELRVYKYRDEIEGRFFLTDNTNLVELVGVMFTPDGYGPWMKKLESLVGARIKVVHNLYEEVRFL